ncbi:MAG: HNH nuclease family protein [Gammaproteobacteria bacterium]|nr:HNH nuclease family protein [Gammaproteobacteria bacterium]
MASRRLRSQKSPVGKPDKKKLDSIVSQARQSQDERNRGYREQSLRLHPWICGRCGREFTRENLQELTVHHIDHNHDNNPPDGSNWENLCVYCHDNEHSRHIDHLAGAGMADTENKTATYNPFADLKGMLNAEKNEL